MLRTRFLALSPRVLSGAELTPLMRELVAEVQESPGSAAAWNNLGVMLEQDEAIPSPMGGEGGKHEPMNRLQCFARAADLAWDDSTVWMNIGASLGSGEKLAVRDAEMTPLGCLLRSVRLDPGNGPAWLNIAFALKPDSTLTLPDVGKVGRLELLSFAAACLERSIAADEDSTDTSVDVGTMLSGCYSMAAGSVVAGHAAADLPQTTDRRDCAVVFPHGANHPRTPLQLIERAVEVSPENVMPLTMAVNLMRPADTLLVSGEACSRGSVCKRILSLDPSIAEAWAALAEGLEPDEPLRLDGRTFTKIEVLVEALRRDIANTSAWKQLGQYCATNASVVSIGDATLSALDCLARALVYDAGDAGVWELAADQLEKSGQESFRVGSEAFDAARCRQTANSLRGHTDE